MSGDIGTNAPAPGVPYFTPAQYPPAGTAADDERVPTLFQPFKIRGVEFQNRIWVSRTFPQILATRALANLHIIYHDRRSPPCASTRPRMEKSPIGTSPIVRYRAILPYP